MVRSAAGGLTDDVGCKDRGQGQGKGKGVGTGKGKENSQGRGECWGRGRGRGTGKPKRKGRHAKTEGKQRHGYAMKISSRMRHVMRTVSRIWHSMTGLPGTRILSPRVPGAALEKCER